MWRFLDKISLVIFMLPLVSRGRPASCPRPRRPRPAAPPLVLLLAAPAPPLISRDRRARRHQHQLLAPGGGGGGGAVPPRPWPPPLRLGAVEAHPDHRPDPDQQADQEPRPEAGEGQPPDQVQVRQGQSQRGRISGKVLANDARDMAVAGGSVKEVASALPHCWETTRRSPLAAVSSDVAMTQTKPK